MKQIIDWLVEWVGGGLLLGFLALLVCLIFRTMIYFVFYYDFDREYSLAPAPQATVQEHLDQIDRKLDLLLQERSNDDKKISD